MIRKIDEYIIDVFKNEYEPQNNYDNSLENVIGDFLDGKFIYTSDAKEFIKLFSSYEFFQLYLAANAENGYATIDINNVSAEDIAYSVFSYVLYDFCYSRIANIKEELDAPYLVENEED